jgi:hypothetical protein
VDITARWRANFLAGDAASVTFWCRWYEYVAMNALKTRTDAELLAATPSDADGRWQPVGPTDPLHQILVAAAEVAVDCGRSTIDVSDVLLAIATDRSAAPLLAELGVQIEAVAGVMARHRARPWPPRADTEN